MLLSSCVTQSLSDDERAWRRGIDRENWFLCEKALAQLGRFTIHFDHTHSGNRPVRAFYIKSDLMRNDCAGVLGEYWAEY
jgi:hypothetical protein